MRRAFIVLFIIYFLFSGFSLWAMDFGIIVDQGASYQRVGEHSQFEYAASVIPRFHALIGDSGEFFISAGLTAEYRRHFLNPDNPGEYQYLWSPIPELFRTEFSWLFDNWDLQLGRIHYFDPLGFITGGLFDGVRFSLHTGAGTFSAGALYTGFLYRRRANIKMTPNEINRHFVRADFNDLANTYFAPSRAIAALDWEHPGLGELLRTRVSLMGQFDLTGAELHTQYLTGRISLPAGAFLFDLGGSLGFIQQSGDFRTALAGDFRAAWILPTAFLSRLSVSGRYASGDNGTFAPFLPVTTWTQGYLLRAQMSGISKLSLEYTARFNRFLTAGFSSSYFIRNDFTTYTGFPVRSTGDDGRLMGNEFFGRLFWNPVSDMQFSLGSGIFMPSLGNTAPDAGNLWRVEMNLILSVF